MLRDFNELKELFVTYGKDIDNLNKTWTKIKAAASQRVDDDVYKRLLLIKDLLERMLIITLDEVKADGFKADSQKEVIIMSAAALYIMLLNKDEVVATITVDDNQLDLPFGDDDELPQF